jgi:hypothetical protein
LLKFPPLTIIFCLHQLPPYAWNVLHRKKCNFTVGQCPEEIKGLGSGKKSLSSSKYNSMPLIHSLSIPLFDHPNSGNTVELKYVWTSPLYVYELSSKSREMWWLCLRIEQVNAQIGAYIQSFILLSFSWDEASNALVKKYKKIKGENTF